MRSTSVLLGALGALASLAAGVDMMDNPWPENFIRRAHAAAVLVGDYVYIEGGEISQKLGDETLPPDEAHTKMNSTLSFNISTSWETEKVNIKSHDKPAPKLSRQVLWQGEDPNVYWIWGGRTIRKINRDSIDKDTIWRFTANGDGGGDWSSEIPSGSDDLDDMHLPSRSTYVTYKNTGFSLGGEQIPDSDPDISSEMQPVQGMITFDLKSKTFSNESTPDVSPYGTMVGATAEYVPIFGDNGVIIILGGYGYTLDVGARTPEHTRRFDNITYFDPDSREWGWQLATGDIPPARVDHCSVGVESGRDTYEIFIFGGHNPTNNKTWENLYVLSLPGFVWTKIEATSGGPRSGQACVATGTKQMITIGGINPDEENPWEDTDELAQGVGVFDMTDLQWQDNYNHQAPDYDSPKPVKDWYSDGGMDGVKWSSKRSEALFTSVNSDDGSKTPVGAIAGGVVGGVAGVSLIAVLAWWLLRRRRKAAAGDYAPTHVEMDGAPKRTELPPHEHAPQSHQSPPPGLAGLAGLAGKETPPGLTHEHSPSELTHKQSPSGLADKKSLTSMPAELDTPVAELDGSSPVHPRAF